LSSLKQNLGDLDKVKRITKLVGFVQCVDGFTNQPFVINGCSDLMFEVFGDKVGEQLNLKKWSRAVCWTLFVTIYVIISSLLSRYKDTCC
jgi:hypothetical protein